jgi:hypothetical protein
LLLRDWPARSAVRQAGGAQGWLLVLLRHQALEAAPPAIIVGACRTFSGIGPFRIEKPGL